MQRQFFSFLALDFLAGHHFRTEIGYCGTQYGCVGIEETRLRSRIHFLRRFHIDPANTGVPRFQLHGTRNQRHLRTTTGAFFRQSKSHLPGRIVADETDGINLLVRRSGCNHDLLSFQLTVCGKKLVQYPDDIFRFFHPPLPHQVAGKLSRARLDDMIAERTENIQILLGRRMRIHIEIHCRSDKHRSFGRKIGCNQHIVGYPVCHLADGRGGGGSNQHGICPQPQVYVAVPRSVALCKELADDRLAGQRRKSDGSNKFFSRRSNHDLHFRSLPDKATNDVASLVRGNTAGNSKNYLFSF